MDLTTRLGGSTVIWANYEYMDIYKCNVKAYK